MVVATAALLGWRATAPSDAAAPEGIPDGAQRAVVERIVDGDTIWVRSAGPGPLVSGATHKIRLLEIDTPETQHPTKGRECGGKLATWFAERHLTGRTVFLLADREETDRYGRFLRYVFTANGAFFNLQAVRTGHARAALYEPNDRYIALMRRAERQARRADRGIWGAPCDYGRRS